MMNHQTDHNEDTFPIGAFCRACDLPQYVNDLGLCDDCAAKLERDLIRMRDWEYSEDAIGVPDERLEALRDRVIRDYGAAYELLEQPHEYKPKNKRSKSRATQRKRAIAAAAIREYTTDDVLQAAQDFIHAQGDEWVNFSRVSQHLYERFYHLKPKHLGLPARSTKACSSSLRIIQIVFKCALNRISAACIGYD